ncbi:MAG: hypothetical protein DMG36_07110 [Acidobacteria bacterium]|nr:MAG: hypothetical protein DMG36_07110 [Acidobacteriota bacterium]
MKRVALLLFLASWLVPLASAQDHFQVGAYGDYFRVTQTSTDMAGLGARVGYKAFSHVMLEGEMSYDFGQAFTERCLSGGCTVTVANSNLKVLHGMFGPKFIGGRHAIRPFLTVKGGFINFRLDPRPPSFSGFVSSVDNLRSNNVSAVLYPAIGGEGHLGPIGLRMEVGDEMYFAGSTHHNPRLAVGPFLRF